MNIRDIKSGDLIEFKYDGGSNPGSVRVVKVVDISSSNFYGYDIYLDMNDNFRNFRVEKISDVKLLHRLEVPKNTVSIEPEGLVLKRKNGDVLVISYKHDVLSISYHKHDTASALDKNFIFKVPTDNDSFVDGVIDVMREFAQ